MIAFQRMVVHHIQNNLQPAFVKPLNHFLKIVDIGTDHIARFQSKEVQCFVSPEIVFQTGIAFRHKSIDRHQFHRRYAQPFQIAQNALMIEPGKGTAFAVRHLRVQFGIAFKVGFVNDAFFNGIPRRLNTLPIKIITSYNRFRHIGGAVQRTVREVFERTVPIIAKQCLMPNQTPGELFGIGVNQKLVRIEAMPLFRQIRPVNTIAVNLSRF